ncbi:FecR domain-containing protein [Dysgonomonas sp. Marseille-P4677]|uniref:FecR family protein n=1 Tax=Dysgonomonas sp. Marseille-P4677 TaxID=2364790 RepID=UPI0019121C82|nr:FecR domain-containing protein [Dysgonomonas sp. Marseille-P4677]MBK5720901.1 FecR domain-containing protein [Dysgonomonas sp. Marseille-P4677]
MKDHTQNKLLLSLLTKYINNQCTEDELVILFNWLKSSESSLEFDFVSRSLWEQINKKMSYPNEESIDRLSKEVDVLFEKLEEERIQPAKKIKPLRWKWVYKVAIVASILFMIGGGYYLFDKSGKKQVQYNEINAGRGDIKEYTLADGTRITLNSESKLLISTDYNKENRTVEIDGECFFEVAKNPDKPFIIKSGNAQIKVLGTSFNLKAYKEDNRLDVTVSTGKVQVNMFDFDMQLRVLPSEHLSIDKTTGEMSKLSFKENHSVDWIKGEFYFENEPITEVIKMINRKFDKKVILKCENCKHVISGSLESKSLEGIVESICFTTGLKSKEEGRNIILYN